uniref:PINc domain-containing protein n=1 Tax=Trichuris muris TaxID=70415 RepID=A0A5S6QPJ7_TRIMR
MGESMLNEVLVSSADFGGDELFGLEKTSTLESDVEVRPKRPPRELYRPPQRRNQALPQCDDTATVMESAAKDYSMLIRGKYRILDVMPKDQRSKLRPPLADRLSDSCQNYRNGRFPRQRGYFTRSGYRTNCNEPWAGKGTASDDLAPRKEFDGRRDQFCNRRSFSRRRYGADSSRFVSRQSARTVADVHGSSERWNMSKLRRFLLESPFGQTPPPNEENACSDEVDPTKGVAAKSSVSETSVTVDSPDLSESDDESEEEECGSQPWESDRSGQSAVDGEEPDTSVSVISPTSASSASQTGMTAIFLDDEGDEDVIAGILRFKRSMMAKADQEEKDASSRKLIKPLLGRGCNGAASGNGILRLPTPISIELGNSQENRSPMSSDTETTLSKQIMSSSDRDVVSRNDDEASSPSGRLEDANLRSVFLKKVKNEMGSDLAVIDSLVSKVRAYLDRQSTATPEMFLEYKSNVQSVVSHYEKLLHQHLEWQLRSVLEKRLWKDALHPFMDSLRKEVRSDWAEYNSNPEYDVVVESASALYVGLLQWYKREFNLDLPEYHEYLTGNLERPVRPCKLPKSADSKLAFASCQRFAIALADLSRYKGEDDPESGYAASEKYSTQAIHLVPHNGRPYSQLALLYNQKNLRLEVAYFLARALAVKHPVGSASDRLAVMYKNVEKESSFLDLYTASCHEETGFLAREISRKNWNSKVLAFSAWLADLTTEQLFKNSICSMLRLHLSLYTGIKVERFSTYARPTLVQFAELFERSDNPMTGLQVVRYVMVCLFSVHWSLCNADGWCEAAELSVRFALSVFYLLISMLHENIDNILRGNVGNVVRKILPAVHLLCQWISTSEVYELICRAPQLDWFNDPRDKDIKWSVFANLCNRLELGKLIKRHCAYDLGKQSGGKSVVLLEDLECCAFFKVFPTYPTTYNIRNDADEVEAATRLRFGSLLNLAYYLDGKDSAFFAYDTKRREFSGFSCLKCLSTHRAQPRSAASDDGDDVAESDSEERSTVNGDNDGSRQASLDVLKTANHQRKVMLSDDRPALGMRLIDLIRYAVIDTNSLIDHLDAVYHILKARRPTVVVPTIVYNELVGLDKSGEKPHAQSRARSAIKMLQEFSHDPSYSVKSVTCSGKLLSSFRFSKNEETIKLENMNDDLIAQICVNMSIKEGISEESSRHFRKVALLTDDRNLKIKAFGLRLYVLSVPLFLERLSTKL